MGEEFTLIDEGRASTVEALTDGGRVRVPVADVERATGWVRKPEGLCRDDVCVPVRDPALDADGLLDLERFAATLRRPLALDVTERAAFLGASAEERGAALASLHLPEIALPDLEGRTHSLAEHRGRKVLLVVYASW